MHQFTSIHDGFNPAVHSWDNKNKKCSPCIDALTALVIAHTHKLNIK